MTWATRLDIEVKVIKIDTEHWQESLSPSASAAQDISLGNLMKSGPSRFPPAKRIVTHKGMDSYEVIWSTVVTVAEELQRPMIEEIKHIGANWEAVHS